jgi:RNA polymerase sigma factor (sigma-70 family)
MDTTLRPDALMTEQNKQVAETVSKKRGRLRDFIRRRVADPGEAEDILQVVFFEFMEAYRLPEPIEQVDAWLFRVARNRIVDRFRKKKAEPLPKVAGESEARHWLEEVPPSPDAGPEAVYARGVLLREIQAALEELPKSRRAVIIAHELEGRGFKELAE